MNKTLNIPEFKTEKEEAEWFDSHQDVVLALFQQAAKDGTLTRGTLAARAITNSSWKCDNPFVMRK